MDEKDREEEIKNYVKEKVQNFPLRGEKQLRSDQAVEKTDQVLTNLSRRRKGELNRSIEKGRLSRRDFLKLLGIGAGSAAAIGFLPVLRKELGTVTPTGQAHNTSGLEFHGGDVDVAEANGYEIWRPTTNTTMADINQDGVTISNVLIDQENGGTLAFRTLDGAENWEIRNVGWKGVGTYDDSGEATYHFKVEGNGLIENVFVTGWGTELAGAWTRSSHQGTIELRNSYFAGFGNNSVYFSNHAESSPSDGQVIIDSCYSRNSSTGNFRIGGSDGNSVVRNSVVVINDPECERGSYFNGDVTARPFYARHTLATARNCAAYVSPEDCMVKRDEYGQGGAYQGYSGGTMKVVNCDVNPDAPKSTSGDVQIESLGDNPRADVLQNCGVPTSAEMAAKGMRQIPDIPEIPGQSTQPVKASNCGSVDTSNTGTDTSTGSSLTTQTITLSGGSSSDILNYQLEAASGITRQDGSGTDSIYGNTATGALIGNSVTYQIEGGLTRFNADSGINIQVNGQSVSKQELLTNYLSCQ